MSENSNLSIDEILSSIKSERDESSKPKVWSMSDIDELLGIGGSDPEPEPVLEKEPEPVAELEPDPIPDSEPEAELEPEPKLEPEPIPVPVHKVVSEKTVVFDSKLIKVTRAKAEPTHISENEPLEDSNEKEESSIIMELADEGTPEKPELTPEEIAEKKALAGKTVGIYPARNENISHQILTERIEKSSGVMDTDKYRERFLNKPKQKLERTADYERLHPDMPDEIIERPGMIIKKSKFTNTADLEPIPTIISADAELNNFDKTIVANSESKPIEHDDDGIDGQIKLSGFGEEEQLEQIDEDHAEETLKAKRDEKIASFKLDSDFSELDKIDEEFVEDDEENTEDEVPTTNSATGAFISDFVNDEYEKPEDAERVKTSLISSERAALISSGVQAGLTIISLIITGIISKSGGNLGLIGKTPVGCGIINVILLALALVCGISTITRGWNGILNKKPNASTGTLLVVLACIIENVIVAVFADNSYTSVSLYTAVGCLALSLSSFSRWLSISRAKHNFEFITNGTQLYSSERIDNEDEAFEIGRGLLIGEPDICYNSKVNTPQGFIENSFEDDPADDFAYKYFYPVLGAALIAAVVFGIIKKDVVVAFGMFAAVCGIAMPSFTLVVSNISLYLTNRKFNKSGAAIVGHRAINNSVDINAYALDSTDIFKKSSCSIIGIKTFHNMRIDDAILYAAALVIESGGPLADIFGNVILGKKELLPPVESLAYEERLGLSAWIHGRRVLFGSRDLLVNHNVEAPERDFEMRYTHDGRKVMYLSIAGKIAAMFVIKYQADKHMRKYLQSVDKAGVSLLVRTCDCNITEEMICRYFNLPLSAVKILSPVSGDIFEKYRKAEKDDAVAGILHNGTIEASLKTIYEARELHANISVNNIVTAIYTAIALVLFLILSITSGPMGITGGQIVLFQVLWGAVAASIPVLKRRFDK